MLRALVALLLILNLVVFLWGWSQDAPLDPPLPPLAQAPGEILLGSEWSGRSDAVAARPEIAPSPRPSYSDPIGGPLPVVPTEGVGPSLPPDGSEPSPPILIPPVVIPPVRADDPGTTHTWSR
jgi:hypothetical protein